MSTYTYNKILSKGIEADLPVQIKEGKLRFTTDTKRLFLDTNGERIEFSDFIKGMTETQIKGILAPLPKIYLASDTKTLWYYDSGWKTIESASTYTEESGHSVNADTATYAINAGTASYSTNCGTANYATSASSATSATNASTATYAVNAGSASNATNAGSATNASTAQYAKNAGSATSATNASTANYATNAATATYATSAGSAASATNASTANYATNAGAANTAVSATNASTAQYAVAAGKATNDGNGNSISETYAPKASPTFTGTPTTPDVAAGDSSGKIANTKFVGTAISNAVAGITQFDYEVVTTLPTTGVKGKIYLVTNGSSTTQNIYDEYIWIGDKYEKIGTTQIDLSNYVNTVTTSGSGNAVTGFTKSGNTLTLNKGATFLTGHPAVSHNSSTASATPAAGSNIDVITSITTDNFGHASSFVKTTVTLPNSVANATNADTATYATSAGSVTWGNVSGKPSTFAPVIGSGSTQAAAGNHNHDTTYWKRTETVNNASTAAYSADVPSWAKASSKPTYTKSEVGLGNVANLDQSKAISSITRSGNTFTATALDGTTSSFTQKDDNSTYALATGTTNGTVNFNNNGTTADVAVKGLAALAYKASLSKSDVGLGNVDNTADANKNVASAVNASTADYAKNGISNITRSGLNFTVTKADGSTFGFDQQDMNTTYTKSSLGLGNVANLDQSKAIKTITRSGLTFTATALDGTTSTFTQQDTNTTYANMTSATAGLAPAGGSGITKYLRQDGSWQVPPDTNTTYANATSTTAGLIKLGGGTTNYLRADGSWAVPTNTTYANMTSAAAGLAPAGGSGTTKYLRQDGSWQVPPDNNTTYTGANGISLSGNTFSNSGVREVSQGTTNGTINVNTNGSTADVSVKGLAALAYKSSLGKSDVGLGNVANVDQSKAIKSITRSGVTFTATALDNTTFSFTQQDNNTTYGNVSTAAAGLAPKVTNTAGFLKGDGTWGIPGDTTYSLVSTAANGLAPKITNTNGYLKGDGTWTVPPNTTYANMTSAAAGLAPAGGSGTTKYLRQDGSWQVPPDTNTTYANFTSAAAGLAPASGGGTTKYLRADGSWQVPPDNNTTYDLSPYAPKASPTFTGSPTTPDVAAGDSSGKIANTKFVTSAISTAIAGVTQFDYEVVTSLPTTGVKGKIYLVANSGPTQNIYDEYIWIGDKYEKLGTTQLDLSDYVNTVTISGTGNAVTSFTKSGNTLTLTKGTTFPTTNTTYAVVSTATNGLAPKVTSTSAYLRGDGTWATPTNTTYANMTSATAGLAPAGGSGTTKYLRQDGSWQVPPNTTYANFTSAAAGLTPASGGGTTKYLRADGSWQVPPDTNTTYSLATITGTLSVDKGGTGKTSGVDAANYFINSLTEGSSPATRDDYYVAQYAGGGTATTTYHRRKVSALFGALNKSDVTTALGYTPPTTNTTYANVTSTTAGLAPAGGSGTTKYLRQDGSWQVPPDTNTTYSLSTLGIGNVKNYDQSKAIKTITRSGVNFTATALDGSTFTFNQQDSNTTYDNVSTTTAGLAPKVTSTSAYLRGDGTWSTPTNTTYSTFTSSANGLAPASGGGTTKYLRADGSWQVPPDTNTTYSFSNNAPTLAWNSASTIGTVGGVALTVKMPANPNTNSTYALATGTTNGTVNFNNNGTTADVAVKGLGSAAYTASTAYATSSHTHSAYVNQNAFSNVVVGTTTIAAETATDTLTLVAGSNVTITPDATNDKVTIAATDTNTWRPIGTGATDAAAGNHNHDGVYLKSVPSQYATTATYTAGSGLSKSGTAFSINANASTCTTSYYPAVSCDFDFGELTSNGETYTH